MRIWLYYANVGGGHRTAATALAEEFKKGYVGVETILVNAIDGSHPFARAALEGGYEFLINRAHWLWKILYRLSRIKILMRVENKLLTWSIGRQLRERLKRERPDKIVALYFLVGPIKEALKKLKLAIPVVIVVTDPFTAHPIWFYYSELLYIVFSEAVSRLARALGVPPERVRVMPLIINNQFLEDPNEYDLTAFRRACGLSAVKKTVLIVGGGNGLPNGERVLEALLSAGLDAQFIAVCGRNKKLRRDLDRLRGRFKQTVRIFGFVDFLNILVALADLVITKGGPGIVTETLILKKPLIITHYIWEQEKGNVQFVLDNRLGYYEPVIKNVPALAAALLADGQATAEFRANCEQVKIKDGTAVIARYIYEHI